LKVGFACNNRCAFCAQGDKRRVLPRRGLDEIAAALNGAARRGVTGVVFTGGEPTLHPDLPRAAALARRLGFSSVQVQTNGRRLSYRPYCELLRRAGVTEFAPSLHGSRAAIHDRLTRSPGAWRQVARGLLNLRALGLPTILNTVVTAENCRDLPDLARLFVRAGVSQFQFAFTHIVGSAALDPRALVPRKSEAMPFVLEGLRVGREAGVPCYVEAIPLCLLRGAEEHASERLIPDGPVLDHGVTLESWEDWRVGVGKAKRELCRTCRWDARCEGPWKEYPELFGWDEFAPVPPAGA
jgi:MoaA/NifB/PqqE/SkfB family radical SAM enzyme